MHEIGPLASAEWHAALVSAQLRRTGHLCELLGRVGPAARSHGIYLLGAASLLILLAGRHDWHMQAEMASIAVASLVSSIAGFAFSAVCGAVLFHIGDSPIHVVQVMIICSIANQVLMTWSARGGIDWRELRVYLAGGATGLAGGVWILLHIARAHYTPALGFFLLAYGAYMLLRKPVVILRQHAALDFLVGVLGGITGGAAGFPGAFVTIWCGMKGWDKSRQRAVFQPFILIMQVLALMVISLMHRQPAGGIGVDPRDLLFIPASLLGTLLGLAVYRRLSDRRFSRVVNVLLMVSGVSYIA